ncbi:MAG: putative photosynthetic complex assembly protein PuhE [Xanthobacteraceae bacterium]
MDCYFLPILYAVLLWWCSTGVILYLDALPRRTFRWSMLGATVLLAAAIYGLVATSNDETMAGAYVAFTCAIAIWGFNEISFLMGYVTGPRTDPCLPGSTGWRSVVHAVGAILYHEAAIAISAAVVVAATWDAPNQIGAWTFLILWIMRLSAKLNVFLGVPNLTEEFLPDHLAYMKSFFRKRPMNGLFPLSVTAATILLGLIAQAAATAATPSAAAGLTLVAALLALAILEHWFLVLPVSIVPLWRWDRRAPPASLSARSASPEPAPDRIDMSSKTPSGLRHPDLSRRPPLSRFERIRAACSR